MAPVVSSAGLSLRPSLRVRLIGLQARPQLNGRKGKVVNLADSSSGLRLCVLLDGDDELKVKPANLQMISDNEGP